MQVNPDEPVTAREYRAMRKRALKYGTGKLQTDLDREDRAFLLHEVQQYEKLHSMPLTFDEAFTDAEVCWWQTDPVIKNKYGRLGAVLDAETIVRDATEE